MAVVKLPSGRTVKVPDGQTKRQIIEFLFDKLDGRDGYEDDRAKLGDQLDTSGWGSTIGGTIGGLAGTVGGIFTSPSVVVNPITLGAAGGAAGAAIGEGIEQWITGKGDWKDVGRDAAIGGALGGIGGGAGSAIVKGGAKAGLVYGAGTGAVGGSREGTGGALTGAAAGAVTGGLAGGALQKGLSAASRKLGLDKPVKSAVQAAKDYGSSYLNAQWLKVTGRKTAGQLQQSAANWQLKRDLANKVFNKSKDLFESKAGRKATSAEIGQIRTASTNEANDIWEQKLRGKADDVLETKVKPKGKIIKHKGQDVLETKEGLYTLDGEFIGDFAMGGLIPGYQTGGQVRRQDPQGRYRQRVAESGALHSAADFVPILGDALAAKEVYDEIQKPDTNWALVGALGGATLIGLVPGIGDAAASAIRSGARKGLAGVDGGVKFFQKKFGNKFSEEDIVKGFEAWKKGSDREALPKNLRGMFDELSHDLRRFEELGGTVSTPKSADYGGAVVPTSDIQDYRPVPGAIETPLVKDEKTLGVLAHEMGHAQNPFGTGITGGPIRKTYADKARAKDLDTDLMSEFYSDRNVQSLLDRHGLLGSEEGEKIRKGWNQYVNSLEEQGEGFIGFAKGSDADYYGQKTQYMDGLMQAWYDQIGKDQIKEATRRRNLSGSDLIDDILNRAKARAQKKESGLKHGGFVWH